MTTPLSDRINEFLDGSPHAVVGASSNRAKYGNKVLRAYLQRGMPVFAINPNEAEVEGLRTYPRVTDVPEPIHGASIITPPQITEQVIEQLRQAGIRHVWMQPGAESPAAIARATQLGLNVIAGGPCILIVLGYSEH